MRLAIFYILCLFVFKLNAQNNARLYSANGALISVYIKDKLYNKTPQASVLLENMMQDTLYLKVEFENQPKQGISIYLLDKGKRTKFMEFDYRLTLHNSKIAVSYTGMYNQTPLPVPLVPPEPVADTSSKYKNSVLGHLCELKNGNIFYFNNLPESGLCKNAMPNEYLSYATFLAGKSTLKSEREQIVENICRYNCLNVDQLNQLLPFIEYELDKLRLVHNAYYNLVDTLNAKKLFKNFKLEASVAELNGFFSNPSKYRNSTRGGCKIADDENTMSIFLLLVSNCNTDFLRIDFLRKNYNSHCYSIEQINAIMQKFVHEREKLDAAKLLYTNCVEKDKYEAINANFVYKENINELNEFIRLQKK